MANFYVDEKIRNVNQSKYLPFTTLQTLVDYAFMWTQSDDSSLLPVSSDELCQTTEVLVTIRDSEVLTLFTDCSRQSNDVLLERKFAGPRHFSTDPAVPHSYLHNFLIRLHSSLGFKSMSIRNSLYNQPTKTYINDKVEST